jgi:hypothetical protein
VIGRQQLLEEKVGRIRKNALEVPDGSLWVTTSHLDGYGSPVTERDDPILRLVPKS